MERVEGGGGKEGEEGERDRETERDREEKEGLTFHSLHARDSTRHGHPVARKLHAPRHVPRSLHQGNARALHVPFLQHLLRFIQDTLAQQQLGLLPCRRALLGGGGGGGSGFLRLLAGALAGAGLAVITWWK